MKVLELHVNGGISLIVVDVVIDVVRYVVDNYVVFVFVIDTVVNKHEISINEMKRGSK